MTMRAASLWQPWASGVADGLKLWETRSWETSHRGELAVASTAGRPKEAGDHLRALLPHRACPQGVVLAVVDLVEVLPIVEPLTDAPLPAGVDCVALDEDGVLRLWRWGDFDGYGVHTGVGASEQEEAWGDYTPGRYVWRFENVRRLAHPVPVKGFQRIYQLDEPTEALVREAL